MLLTILCIVGWLLFGITLYLSVRVDGYHDRRFNLLLAEDKKIVEMYNDLAIQHNKLIDRIENGQKIPVKIVSGKKDTSLN